MSERMHMSAAPAFPIKCLDGSIEPGLTKREYFAALAMQGLYASPYMADFQALAEGTGGKLAVPRMLANAAVLQADALIAELAKERP